MNYLFKTARLRARNFTIDDAAMLNKLHSDKIVVSTTSGSSQSLEETRQEIIKIIDHNTNHQVTQLAFFNENDEFVGRCGIIYRAFASADDYSYEIRYALHRHFQGMGYGLEMVKGYLDFVFLNNNKIEKVTAAVRLDGLEASSKILLKLGFAYVGNKVFLGNGKETKIYEISSHLFLQL